MLCDCRLFIYFNLFGLFSDYSPMLRMSFITFSTNAVTIMKLTENRFMSLQNIS